jgi:3-phenylpropionate/cinnamic acid dioxygenase small subunit
MRHEQDPRSGIEAFLYAEARALDDRDWDTWLAFYAPDASFWMPVSVVDSIVLAVD